MAHALRLARRGLYSAHPNPMVGCVLVREGAIVGRGWHHQAGEPHAEINALHDARGDARGAIAYVTLEPCAHEGRTGPCTTALIEAGVGAVVAAMEDPFPEVSGRGFAALRAAGIGVRSGLLQAEAAALNAGFVARHSRQRPFVRLKMAASLDGCTAMANGESHWITGTAARQDVQRLRARSGAVLTGIGTVLEDDPSLTVRDKSLSPRQPLRAVADSRLRMPPASCMLTLPGRTELFCIEDGRRETLERAGATVHLLPAVDGRVDLEAVLRELAAMQVNDLLVEAGRQLAGALLAAGLVDELVVYQSPHFMGSETRGMFATPGWARLVQRMALDIVDVRRVGADTRTIARPVPEAG
ncbi:MAG: bifunctional diaminohydroxyphosphoribosylaminopyrimidine deaminase/5-amino-6-(5-phosphoribosylamino)uracil reductase RibD [Gammaproteobacteria bacterium]|nr:MAG: bifunctional diaminohydroxyphosphoribosylaminopyrimidine deaminase/5-amino-6-(5-phosphoribosylamino)uracil reductase RibD [Gammaproteobacteria bacterium]